MTWLKKTPKREGETFSVKWFPDHSKTVVSNHICSVATFATIVATKVLLSPLLSEFERYKVYLPLELQLWTTVCRHMWRMATRLDNTALKYIFNCLGQCFSTGVPRRSSVPSIYFLYFGVPSNLFSKLVCRKLIKVENHWSRDSIGKRYVNEEELYLLKTLQFWFESRYESNTT